jgi:hypothetical protein
VDLNIITHLVNHEKSSPLYGMIREVGIDNEDAGFSSSQFIRSLRSLNITLTECFTDCTDDEFKRRFATIVKAYWQGIKMLIPSAFSNPDSYRLTTTATGANMMNQALGMKNGIFERLYNGGARISEPKTYADFIEGTRYTDPNHPEFIWANECSETIVGDSQAKDHADKFLEAITEKFVGVI